MIVRLLLALLIAVATYSHADAANRFSTGRSGGGGGGGGYSVAARIAEIRAHAEFGSYFTDTSDPNAPSGLQAPTAPNGTSACVGGLTPVTVTSLSSFRTEAAGNCKTITLSPTGGDGSGNYSEALVTAYEITGSDLEIVLTGTTLTDTPELAYGLHTHPMSRRVKVTNGTINGSWYLEGRDIHVYNTTFTPPNGSGDNDRRRSVLGGHRILVEHARSDQVQSFLTDTSTEALFEGSISGTTLTVTSIEYGTLPVGSRLVPLSAGLVTAGTYITACPGGDCSATGAYTVSTSQTVSAGNMRAVTRSTNAILANSWVSAYTGTDGQSENTSRFNACHLCGVMDSKLVSSTDANSKYTLRAHAGYGTVNITTGNIFWINIQSENNGALSQEPGASGVYPAVDAIIVHGLKVYRPSGVNTGGRLGIDRTNSGGTNVVTSFFWMKCSKSYSAAPDGDEGTAGTGWVPGGFNAPHASWTTVVDAATSLANGNSIEAYTAPPPAWDYYTSTPTFGSC